MKLFSYKNQSSFKRIIRIHCCEKVNREQMCLCSAVAQPFGKHFWLIFFCGVFTVDFASCFFFLRRCRCHFLLHVVVGADFCCYFFFLILYLLVSLLVFFCSPSFRKGKSVFVFVLCVCVCVCVKEYRHEHTNTHTHIQ